jgi:hypothetical protein
MFVSDLEGQAMLRFGAYLFAWLLSASSLALAVPARPLYQPPPAVKTPARPTVNLNGTTWQGTYLDAIRVFIFEPDGTISYKASAKTKVINRKCGTWKFDGETLTFEHYHNLKNVLMEYRGKLQDAKTIVGESTTRKGGRSLEILTLVNP